MESKPMRKDFKEGKYIGTCQNYYGGHSHPAFCEYAITKFFKNKNIDYKYHICSCNSNSIYFCFDDYDEPKTIRVSDHKSKFKGNTIIFEDFENENRNTIFEAVRKKYVELYK